MAYLFSIFKSMLEFGWIAAGIKAELPVWAALCFVLAYHLGGMFGKTFIIGRRLTYIAGGGAAIFIAAAGCFDHSSSTSLLLQGSAVLMLSSGIHSIEKFLHGSKLVIPCYIGIGLALSPLAAYFPIAVLSCIAVAVMAGAYLVPDRKPHFRWKKTPRRYLALLIAEYCGRAVWIYPIFATATLLLGDYSAAILCLTFIARYNGIPIFAVLTRSFLSLHFVSRIWIFVCLCACCFFEPGLFLFASWLYASLGEECTFARKEICREIKLYRISSEHMGDSVGNILGISIAVILSLLMDEKAVNTAALLSAIMALVTVCILLSLIHQHIRKHIQIMIKQHLEVRVK